MRILSLFIVVCALSTFFSTEVFSEQNSSTIDSFVTDVVVEYEAGGKLIQVGDYLIVVPRQIVVQKGNGLIIPGKEENLNLGKLVQASLAGKNSDGLWTARQFIVYEGAGLDEALQQFTDDEQDVMEAKIVSFDNTADGQETTNEVGLPQQKGSDDIRLQDGVWTN